MVKRVVLLIAHSGYQPIEYGVTKELLTQAGIEVITASDEPGLATAQDESTTPIDITLDALDPADYDGLFIIGGPGTLDCLDNHSVYTCIDQMMLMHRPYGAICIAPRILAKAQALVGKKATGWNGDNALEQLFQHYDVIYMREPVVVDGLAVTASGPDAAQDFAQAIIQLLAHT